VFGAAVSVERIATGDAADHQPFARYHYTKCALERIEPQNSPGGFIFRMREKPVAPVNAAPGD
jgi:hypothetical protein